MTHYSSQPQPVASAAERIQVALQHGRLSEASELVGELQRAAPQNPNTLFFSGILEWKRGEFEQAIEFLSKACALSPMTANCHHWLGNSLHSAGKFGEAINAFARATALAPSEATQFNMDMARSDQAKEKIATESVRQSHVSRSHLPLRRAIDVAHEFARRRIDAPAGPPISKASHAGIISFVTCSVTPEKLARLRSSLNRAMGCCAWELVSVLDAASLCEGYARGFARSTGDIVVFCHDDIEVLCDNFPGRLLDALDGADLFGPVGVTHLDGPALCWTGQQHLHGAVTHKGTAGAFHPGIGSASGPRIDDAIALDGLFIATRRHVVERVGFDQETFDGFHFYDLDFSYRARKLGFRVRIQTDLHLLHASRGSFDERYLHYSIKFQRKFNEFADPPPFVQPVIHEVRVNSVVEAQRTHCWLQHWIAQALADAAT